MGSSITFLSKTTVNNIIKVLAEIIQEEVVQTIKNQCNRKVYNNDGWNCLTSLLQTS